MAKPTLWIHFEGHADAFKHSEHIQTDSDLDDLRSSLCERHEFLKGVKPDRIGFFSYNNRNEPLMEDTLLKDLTTTDTAPLIIRYPVSDSHVVVRCNFSTKWFRCSFPHDSGIWYLVRAYCQQNFESLPTDVLYFFIYNKDKNKGSAGEEMIKNEFQLNIAVSKIKPNEENEREINLSIRIEGWFARMNWMP
ncbi:hypothetical protein C2G38_984339 [Gigaspora rosea]|uniref:Uncharacterized protein n=1 Tax=Gigaspora rosea TaxID=44941 RepID=A0A397TXH9_9GLOM|nr:hypothetical protein C2G38_984339 [Gigaspora rosea]